MRSLAHSDAGTPGLVQEEQPPGEFAPSPSISLIHSQHTHKHTHPLARQAWSKKNNPQGKKEDKPKTAKSDKKGKGKGKKKK